MDRIGCDTIRYDNRIRLCPYTGKYESEKACILGYFTHCVKYSNPRIFFLISLHPWHFRILTWRKDAQNSEGYLYLHPSHQKAKMLWEWDCLTPCRNPRRKNAVQMDFLREEIINLKTYYSLWACFCLHFLGYQRLIFSFDFFISS